MKVDASGLQGVLHGSDQFVIPLFQRYYVWDRNNWQRLWDDITELLEPDAPTEHFMGSLVCMQGDNAPGKVPQYLVIDGQQRLTTFVILLCALRDEATEQERDEVAGEIQDNYLTHKYKKGMAHYKVVPRLRDRQAVFDLVDRKPVDKETRVGQAYDFFRKKLRSTVDINGAEHLDKLLIVTVSRLSLVMITLK